LENPLEGTPEDVKLDRPEDPLKKLHKQYSLDDASISLGYSSDNEESLRSPLPQIQLPAKAEQEMKSLAEQAMVQHKNKTPLSTEHSIYPPTEITELLFASTGKSQKRQEKIPPYSSAIQHYIGKEQNAAFHAVYDSIEVIGIFDGHGPIIEINVGASVAQLASKICKSQFCKLLRGQGGNIALTLDLLCTKIHKSIIRKPSLRMGGTTAAIACRDLKTGNIYTATVGTAEVTLYVEIEEKVYPWPLSYMQRWEENIGTLRQYYRREKTRGLFVTLDKKLRATRTALELAEMDPDLPDRLPTLPFALGVYNSAGQWTRLAGSLGDVTFPLLEHRPRITQVSTSIPGLEILAMVATSDPFKFFLSELEITSAITDWHASCTPTAERLAENLIDLWNKRKPSEDDVTIVALCQKSSIGDSI
jgi:serine/threonine protein phosphatase PrpC